MAIRRYTKASDNSPAWGYAVVDDIQGTGVFKLPIEWTIPPQDGLVCFAQSFNLPPEFIPTSGAILRTLAQSSPTTLYAIKETVAAATPTTIGATKHTSIIHPVEMDTIKHGTWQLATAGSGAADGVSLLMKEFVAVTTLYAIVHDDGEIQGNISYFGSGTDVSSSYGLVTGTRWSLATNLTSDDDFAEMVFVNGVQVIGDIYDYYQSYGGGVYDMFKMEDGTVEIQFVDPVVAPATRFFVIFTRIPEPRINIRFEDPFDEDGVWIEYFNIPKGDMIISYYIT